MTLDEEAILARWQEARERGIPPEHRLSESAPSETEKTSEEKQ